MTIVVVSFYPTNQTKSRCPSEATTHKVTNVWPSPSRRQRWRPTRVSYNTLCRPPPPHYFVQNNYYDILILYLLNTHMNSTWRPQQLPRVRFPRTQVYITTTYIRLHTVHGLAISASRISKVIRYIIYTIYDWNTPNIRDDSFIQNNYLVSTSLTSNKTIV